MGGAWAWAFKPPPAVTEGWNRGAGGGQRDCTAPARPPVLPPPASLQSAEGRLGDVGPVPPRQDRGTPPLPSPPGGRLRPKPSPTEPTRRAPPDRHLPASFPQ